LTDILNIKGGDIVEIEIEKLTFQGAGLGRISSRDTTGHIDGLAVFVDGACPGDVLRVRITKKNKSYATARIVEIVKPSPHRVKPHCALANACGGCCWGFIDYDFTLQQKKLIVQEALHGVKHSPEILDTLKSPDTLEFRHKIQYPIRQTKVSKRILAGYFKTGSHEIVNVKHCPIQPEVVDKIIDFVRSEWVLGAYDEKTGKGLLKHAVIRKSSSGEGLLLTLVLNSARVEKGVTDFANKIKTAHKEITGVLVNFNPDAVNTILSKEFQLIAGDDFIFEAAGSKRYKISANSFFQTNPKCAAVLFDVVKGFVGEGSSVLDAYGGVGAIGIWVSDKAKSVVLVEESESAVKNAKENFKLNEVKNYAEMSERNKNKVFNSQANETKRSAVRYEVFLGDAKICFNEFLIKKRKFDHVILDPPRKGCERKALELISKLTNSIIYVSCNPQTLSRDIKILEDKGFTCKKIQPVDMFPHSYHVECVALIERNTQ